MAARWAAPQKPPKAAPSIPGDPRTGTPAQQAQPPRRSKCARNDHAAHQASNPTSATLTTCQPSRERPAKGQPAHPTATTAPPETQQRPYAILRNTGKKSPQYSVETPSPGRPQLSELL